MVLTWCSRQWGGCMGGEPLQSCNPWCPPTTVKATTIHTKVSILPGCRRQSPPGAGEGIRKTLTPQKTLLSVERCLPEPPGWRFHQAVGDSLLLRKLNWSSKKPTINSFQQSHRPTECLWTPLRPQAPHLNIGVDILNRYCVPGALRPYPHSGR